MESYQCPRVNWLLYPSGIVLDLPLAGDVGVGILSIVVLLAGQFILKLVGTLFDDCVDMFATGMAKANSLRHLFRLAQHRLEFFNCFVFLFCDLRQVKVLPLDLMLNRGAMPK